jgi:hypothetical protein
VRGKGVTQEEGRLRVRAKWVTPWDVILDNLNGVTIQVDNLKT